MLSARDILRELSAARELPIDQYRRYDPTIVENLLARSVVPAPSPDPVLTGEAILSEVRRATRDRFRRTGVIR